MATKKQQRRRQKLKRHEYEEVFLDEEGNELPPEEAEELVGQSSTRKAERRKTEPSARGTGRTIDPPSWRRTLRRGALFFPLMLAVVFLLSPDLTTPAKVINTLVLMAFFIPFSYFMDSMMYRSFQRRVARTGEKK
jgi:cytochrome c-type biogenesis protein CcmH/NrfG